MIEYMCMVHLKKEAYLVDRQAYYLLCRLQEVEFGNEDSEDKYMDDIASDEEKMKMYRAILDWLTNQRRAIRLARTPTHLIIKFNEEEE